MYLWSLKDKCQIFSQIRRSALSGKGYKVKKYPVPYSNSAITQTPIDNKYVNKWILQKRNLYRRVVHHTFSTIFHEDYELSKYSMSMVRKRQILLKYLL